MALLKSSQFEEHHRSGSGAVVLNLGDLKQQAEALKARAREEAEAVVAGARAEAEREAEAVRAAAQTAGHAEGVAAGHAEGLAAGRAEALEAWQNQFAQLSAGWEQALQTWEAVATGLRHEGAAALTELSVALAEKVVKQHVAGDAASPVVVEQARAALAMVLVPMDVTVRVCPDDHAALEAALPELCAAFPSLSHVSLLEDDAVDRGGCTVSHGRGQIDARVRTQLDRLAALITGGVEEAAEPEPEPVVDPAEVRVAHEAEVAEPEPAVEASSKPAPEADVAE